MTRIAIFDYGAGNLFSLKSSLERNGAESVDIIHNLKELSKFDGLILPGVGNFDPAVKSIESSAGYLDKAIDNCMPLLGICLGMEILFNKSEEGKLEGLKILSGEVVMLPKGKVKVPHMGWNNLKIKTQSKLLKGVKDKSWVYFVHSYKTVPKDHKLVVATSDYGVSIPATIERNNLIGVQFHPEKSGDVGALMIKNFIELCKNEAK
ncbi:MAG: imidazole glycerol phosphate synthase subunit HisH [Thermoproteota archaeon]|nr:imidazole glycerol phosphate synthase subunit HisH [Thermoproteota archaeon]